VSTTSIGREGEKIAGELLRSKGFEIIETNFHFGHGEIDIIARDGEYIVFCEVKARRGERFGDPVLAITPTKQRQLRKIAEGYLYRNNLFGTPCRFDVVTVRWDRDHPECRHIPNAFTFFDDAT